VSADRSSPRGHCANEARKRANTERLRTSIDFDFGGSSWRALPQRAAFWHEARWLVVADLHLGKSATFRARGVPVPHGTTHANLERLTALIDSLRPRRLVFLGDLLHAREALASAALVRFEQWRRQHVDLAMTLVEGNHDRSAGRLPAQLSIDIVTEPWCHSGIAFCHHPQRSNGHAIVAGHLHPCVRLYGAASDSVRMPCFWQREELLTLPAFGEFTGGASIAREPGDRVLAIVDDRLIEIPRLR
jgi:DNA ligase-associated metallophosphoesterase